MYCEKCHRHSPANFQNCAYCGVPLALEKKKAPEKFKKKFDFKIKVSLKTLVSISLVIALLLSVSAVVTAVFTSSKPEGVVKNFVKAIETSDKELFVSIYDKYLYEYKKEYRYFGHEETFNQLSSAVDESREFYSQKCGSNFKLKYEVKESKSLTDSELTIFNDVLEHSFKYMTFPSQVEILSVEITSNGEEGEYKSIYNDFWCMKIKGKWYIVDKTVSAEYMKTS